MTRTQGRCRDVGQPRLLGVESVGVTPEVIVEVGPLLGVRVPEVPVPLTPPVARSTLRPRPPTLEGHLVGGGRE